MIWDKILTYIIVFATGGAICAIAQILIVRTKLTPARILIIFLLVGILLQTVGIYEPAYKVLKAGLSVPIIGFGAQLAKGAIEFTQKYGVVGALAGGLAQTAFGVGTAVVASFFVTLLFSSKTKKK